MGTFSDVVVGSLGDTIVVEVGTVLAWDLGNKVSFLPGKAPGSGGMTAEWQVATDLLFDRTAKLLPEHSKDRKSVV